MDTSSVSFARRERGALCDSALAAGASAPTLCTGWTVHDLIVHLLVRERRPLALAGVVVPRFSGLLDRASARLAQRPFEELVALLRTPPVPLRPQLAEALVNTLELFVHHEDVRRGQVGWTPRTLAPDDEAALWRQLPLMGRLLVRPAGVPVAIEAGGRRAVLRGGEDPVVVSGPVGEVTLFLFGRSSVADVSLDGPQERVERLRGADLGL